MSNGASADPWAWLGLLKWSLSYADGTKDNSDITPMSDEDKAFLERVMKEGIIDENERMKFILGESSKAMEFYKARSLGTKIADPPISDEALEDLLQELRDIVEQIDYARAFCSLKGLPFLIGCVTEGKAVPETIRVVCMGILSTLCQNNPPVQKELLELGAIKTLSEIFFLDDTSQSLKARTMQAISSIVRNHELAETVFCNLEQSSELIMNGLDAKASLQLKTKTLFFFRALVTSDSATSTCAQVFGNAIAYIADNYLADNSNSPEIRELSIALLVQLLEMQRGINTILERKDSLAALGVQRISHLRSLVGEDREFAQVELEYWETFIILLARAKPECEIEDKQETLLLTN